MKKTYIFILLCSLIATSCLYEDKGNYDYVSLPEIVVEGIKEDYGTMKLIDDTLKITPTIRFGDEVDENLFECKWYLRKPAELVKISDTKDLTYQLIHGGNNTIQLEVIHKATKLRCLVKTKCNVASDTELGWYVVKETADGNTDMDGHLFNSNIPYFQKDNIISAILGAPLLGKPVGFDYVAYRWHDKESGQLVNTKALFPVSTEDIAIMRITDLKSLAKFEELFLFPMPQKGNRKMYATAASDDCQLLFFGDGRVTTLYSGKSSQYMTTPLGEFKLSGFANTYTLCSGLVMYDNLKGSFCYITPTISDLKLCVDNTVKKLPARNINGELLFFLNSAGSVPGMPKFTGIGHALIRKYSNSDSLLYVQMDMDVVKRNLMSSVSMIEKIDTLLAKNYTFHNSSVFCVHRTAGTPLYFAKDGKIHGLNKNAKPMTETMNILDYGDEEITLIKHYYGKANGGLTQYFVVATYKDGKYKLYVYNLGFTGAIVPGMVPENVYTGEGKVRFVRFVAPDNTKSNYMYS